VLDEDAAAHAPAVVHGELRLVCVMAMVQVIDYIVPVVVTSGCDFRMDNLVYDEQLQVRAAASAASWSLIPIKYVGCRAW
jgi:hypothetical protein